MDRVPDFESVGWGFESLRGHTETPLHRAVFFVIKLTSHPVGEGGIISWLGVSPYRGRASRAGGTVAPLEKAVFFFLFVRKGL